MFYNRHLICIYHLLILCYLLEVSIVLLFHYIYLIMLVTVIILYQNQCGTMFYCHLLIFLSAV